MTIIRKIKQLKRIGPDSNWVFLTKNQILGKELREEKEKKYPSLFFMPIRRPALVVAPLVVLAAVLGGLFVYFNFLPQTLQLPVAEQLPETQPPQEIVASLQALQEGLQKVTLGLENLQKARDLNQVLVMTEVIKATAKQGQEVVEQVKTKNSSQTKQVLASLEGVGEAYQALNEEVSNMQAMFIGNLIEDLSQRTLSPEDESRLEKARDSYNEGNVGGAILWLTKIEAIR